jgi:hypothetical protein
MEVTGMPFDLLIINGLVKDKRDPERPEAMEKSILGTAGSNALCLNEE